MRRLRLNESNVSFSAVTKMFFLKSKAKNRENDKKGFAEKIFSGKKCLGTKLTTKRDVVYFCMTS
jgi:hypothetical protein